MTNEPTGASAREILTLLLDALTDTDLDPAPAALGLFIPGHYSADDLAQDAEFAWRVHTFAERLLIAVAVRGKVMGTGGIQTVLNSWPVSRGFMEARARIGNMLDMDRVRIEDPRTWNAACNCDGCPDPDTGEPRTAQWWQDYAANHEPQPLSARQLKKAAGLTRDARHAARWRGKGPVEQWEPDTGTVSVSGLPISGDKPERAEVSVTAIE